MLPFVSAVVPAKGEAENLPYVLERLDGQVDEIVVVLTPDDEVSAALVRSVCPDAHVVRQRHPGKGAALSSGFAAAAGEIVVALDADGSMDPVEIPAFVGALMAGADLAKGSRFSSGGGSCDITPIRRLGNFALRFTANRLFAGRWSDLAYGYFAMWSSTVSDLGLDRIDRQDRPGRGCGFEIEALIFTRAARAGLRVVEVASVEYARRAGRSNLRVLPDGFRVLGTILAERVRPARRLPAGTRRQGVVRAAG